MKATALIRRSVVGSSVGLWHCRNVSDKGDKLTLSCYGMGDGHGHWGGEMRRGERDGMGMGVDLGMGMGMGVDLGMER